MKRTCRTGILPRSDPAALLRFWQTRSDPGRKQGAVSPPAKHPEAAPAPSPANRTLPPPQKPQSVHPPKNKSGHPKKHLTTPLPHDIIYKQSSKAYRGVEQLEARRAHNPEVVGSSPASATIKTTVFKGKTVVFLCKKFGFLRAVFPSFPLWLTFSQLHCFILCGFSMRWKTHLPLSDPLLPEHESKYLPWWSAACALLFWLHQ